MSLHAELTEEAKRLVERQRKVSVVSGVAISFLSIVLLVLAMIAVSMKAVLVEEIPVAFTHIPEEEEKPVHVPEKLQQLAQYKPSAPSSTMVRVIATLADPPLSIPVPDVEMNTPSADFGEGDGFGDGDVFGKEWDGERMSIKLFGKDLGVKSIGVVLDVSRSMGPHLGRVLDEIDRLAPGSPVLMVFGCSVGKDQNEAQLITSTAREKFLKMWYLMQHMDYVSAARDPVKTEVDLSKEVPAPEVFAKLENRQDTYFSGLETNSSAANAILSRKFRKVQAVYWFADFRDEIDAEGAQEVLKGLKRRHQKLFIHATRSGESLGQARDTIAIPSGGDQLVEPVGK